MKYLLIIPFFIFSTVNTIAGERYTINDDFFKKNGWKKPVHTKLITSTAYDYDSPKYLTYYGFRHGAVDIIAPAGSSIYAIDDGEIIELHRDSSKNKNMSIIYIKHKTDKNKEFLGIYGHIYATGELSAGKTVRKGEKIGSVKKFGSPEHIHFGIGLDTSKHPLSFGGIKDQIVDPIKFLKSNSNNIRGVFDGAGSLINPEKECFGCNKDDAMMHPHPGVGSTVVFQWLYNKSKCDFLDVTADKNIEVEIKSKGWSGSLIQDAFKTTLSSSSPVSLSKSSGWTTFAITSTNSISSSTRVTATCRTPSDTYHGGSRLPTEKSPVDVTFDYYWAGTGSIISHAGENGKNGYGVRQDVAVTFSPKKSLTSFQWRSSSSCKELKIIDGNNPSLQHDASVLIKYWSVKNFNKTEECSSLPCTIKNKDIDTYYVIKIKSTENEFNGGKIKVMCN